MFIEEEQHISESLVWPEDQHARGVSQMKYLLPAQQALRINIDNNYSGTKAVTVGSGRIN